MKLFLNEVSQQVLIPFVRSYLKLYSTMPIAKLASFLGLVSGYHRVFRASLVPLFVLSPIRSQLSASDFDFNGFCRHHTGDNFLNS